MADQPTIKLSSFEKGLVSRKIRTIDYPADALESGQDVLLAEGGIVVRDGSSTLKPAASDPTVPAIMAQQVFFPTNQQSYVVAQVKGTRAIVWGAIEDGPVRRAHTIVYDAERGRYLLFGGESDSGYENDVWEFIDDAWAEVTTNGTPPSARYGHTAVMNTDGCMYVFGGADISGRLNDLWKFDCETDTWAEITLSGDVPSVREFHAAVLISSNIMMICGGGDGSSDRAAQYFYDINLGSGVCTETLGTLSPDPPPYFHGRRGHSLVYDGSRYCYVVGGIISLEYAENDLWRLDRTTGTWTRLADMPETITSGITDHKAFYCSGYVIVLTGMGDIVYTYNEAYQVCSIADAEWISVAPDGDIGQRRQAGGAMNPETGEILIQGGFDADDVITGSGFIAPALCSAEGAGQALRGVYGLYASNTHLPTTSATFESVMDLTADSGVMQCATLGDRLILTEGVSHVPHVFLPGTLTTDPVSSWAQPIRVLVTYDGVLDNAHDVSDSVLDNDLDSYADIGGVTTRGAVLICCDVPTIEGFYFEFETPSNAEGAIRQFSDTKLLNNENNISQGNWKGNVVAYYRDGAKAGHFEGTPYPLTESVAATNVGGGIVGIPCAGHPFVEGDTVTLHDTTNYDDSHVLPSQAGAPAGVFYITAAYVAETFDGSEYAGLNVGTDLYLEPGQKIFTTRHSDSAVESAAIVDIDGDGTTPASVILTADIFDGDVTGVYGLRIVTANDTSQVSLTRTDDVTITLLERTLSGVTLLRYELPTGTDNAPASYRFVISADDFGPSAIECEYLRFTLEPGLLSFQTYKPSAGGSSSSSVNTTVTIHGLFISSMSFVRRHGESSYGYPDTTPVQITAGGSSTVESLATAVVTDWITFPFNPANDHLFHVELYDDSSVRSRSWGPDDPHIVYTKLAQGYTLSREFDANYDNTRAELLVTKVEGLVTARYPLAIYPCVSTDAQEIDGVTYGSQIELYGSDSIESVTILCDIPGSSAVYCSFSFDERFSFWVYDNSFDAWRMIAKLAATDTWQYNSGASGEETWIDTSSADPWLALQAAFAIAANQMTPTEAEAITQEQWFLKTGAVKFDYALGLQADQTAPDHDVAPSVLSVNVNTTNKGGNQIGAYVNGQWQSQGVWTNNTVVGDISFAQNGTITPNNGSATATYGVISDIPGYWFRVMMRGTAPGTTLTKVRFKAPCQPLQNIGNGRPDIALGVVFHDYSSGFIYDYSVKMADYSETVLGAAVIPAQVDDEVLIGYPFRFNEMEFVFANVTNSEISAATYWYWNGLEWVTLSVTDGTIENSKCWHRRGKVKFAPPTDWKRQVPLQGLTFHESTAGGRIRVGYWIRITFSAAITETTQLAEVRVSPVPDALVKHAGCAVVQNRLALWGRPDAPGQVDISRECQEYGLNGYDAYSYNTQYQIIAGISAYNTLLLGNPTEWNLLRALSAEQGIVFEKQEAARHIPVSSRVIARAPLPGEDGGKYGLYYINRYGAFCQTGLVSDAAYGTARVITLSELVAWWDGKSIPRLDLDNLDIAVTEYFPEKNLVLWAVPMIVDYPVDLATVTQEMSTDPTPVPTGRVIVAAANHGRSAGDVIRITGTSYLNGDHTLHANTDADNLVFTATYKAETLAPCARYSVVGATQTTNNRIVAFDVNLKVWLPPLNLACSTLFCAYDYLAAAPGHLGTLRLYGGFYDGSLRKIFDPDATQDISTDILAWAETGWIHFGNPETQLQLQELWVWGKTTAVNGVRVTVGFRFYETGGTRDVYVTRVLSGLTNPGRDVGLAVDDPRKYGNIMKIRLDLIGPADIRGIELGLPDLREGALVR